MVNRLWLKIATIAFVFIGCERVDGDVSESVQQKTRVPGLSSSQFPLEQDLAILLPRDREHWIAIDTPTSTGADLFSSRVVVYKDVEEDS